MNWPAFPFGTSAFDTMTARQKRLCVDILAAVVIATIALALANLTWRLMGYHSVEPQAVPPAAPAGGSDIAPLLALAPFGIASGGTIEQGGGDLVLKAIFASTNPAESTALIAGPDGEVIPVSIGDATPGGVVEAIDPEKVTLRTGSGLRVLGFNPDAPPTADATGNNRRGGGSGPTAPRNSAPARSGGVESIRSLIPESSRNSGDGATPPSASPPAPAAADPPSIEPSRQGSATPGGYRVGPALPAPLRAAGIRSGDVIRSLNGQAVASGTSQGDLLRRARAAGSARIELLRDGKSVSLTLPVR
ncbi:MAG: type II secretion system protein N [Pontixanthobacter sp.]